MVQIKPSESLLGETNCSVIVMNVAILVIRLNVAYHTNHIQFYMYFSILNIAAKLKNV